MQPWMWQERTRYWITIKHQGIRAILLSIRLEDWLRSSYFSTICYPTRAEAVDRHG